MAVKKAPTPEPEYAPPTRGGAFIRQKDGELREIPPRMRPVPTAEPEPAPAAPPADSNI